MKTYFTLIFTLCTLLSSQLYGQNCEPDDFYQDSTGGVYPRPVSDSLPEAGIDKVACVGQEYYFNFTVKVPDTILFNGVPLVILRLRLRSSEPISGLPSGISHICEPETCDMLAGTLGCIALTGIPDETNTPGDYPLIIKIDLVTTFGVIPTEFPNPALAPGQYILKLEDGNSEECMSSFVKQSRQVKPILISPNPGLNNDDLYIHLPEHISGKGSITFFDLSGKAVYYQNEDLLRGIWRINTADLPNGVYLLEITTENEHFTAKYIR